MNTRRAIQIRVRRRGRIWMWGLTGTNTTGDTDMFTGMGRCQNPPSFSARPFPATGTAAAGWHTETTSSARARCSPSLAARPLAPHSCTLARPVTTDFASPSTILKPRSSASRTPSPHAMPAQRPRPAVLRCQERREGAPSLGAGSERLLQRARNGRSFSRKGHFTLSKLLIVSEPFGKSSCFT